MLTSTVIDRPASASLSLEDVPPYADTTFVASGDAGTGHGSTDRGRRRAVLAMLAGGLTLIAAGVGITQIAGTDARRSPAGDRPAAMAAAPTAAAAAPAFNLSAGDVSVVTQVYAPGQGSGWHSHAGIHAVAILSGTLTVYDAQCRAETFGPGKPYIGGQQPHLAVNEAATPVDMVTTYVGSPAGNNLTQHPQPSAGCQVGR